MAATHNSVQYYFSKISNVHLSVVMEKVRECEKITFMNRKLGPAVYENTDAVSNPVWSIRGKW